MVKSKLRVFIASICAMVLAAASAQPPDTTFHIYLLLGQSNMAGRGALDAESKTIHPQVWMLDSLDQWLPATDPLHYDKPALIGVGPGLAFAKALLGEKEKIKIGLVPCAMGGSPINVWVPGAEYLDKFHPYDDAIRRAKLAQQRGGLKGILWHQGESDNDSLHAAQYLANLSELVNRLRTELGEPNLPFVAGEIGYFLKDNFINPVIHQIHGTIPYTAVVSAEGLGHKGDQIHFSTEAARELGRRYAKAMVELQQGGRR